MTGDQQVLVLARSEVERLLDLETCTLAVERAFRLLGEGRAEPSSVLSLHVDGGVFHIKVGVLETERSYFVAKVNGNFPLNTTREGLPTIQGVLVLADARNGRPLALMDSLAITTRRTAAATAVAACHLARFGSRVATIVGCGVQSRVQLEAIRAMLPIEQVFAVDREECRAQRFAVECAPLLGLDIVATQDLAGAIGRSDVVVTCTTSREPLLLDGVVRPGTFIAAVGADNPEKHEIEPRLMARCKVVVDDLEQCASLGDLHHAIEARAMTREDVYATLGELVADRKPGRTDADEITLFDSTGIGLQDVAAAAVLYERASRQGSGIAVSLAG